MKLYYVLLTLSLLTSTQFIVAQTGVQKKQVNGQTALAPIGPNDFKGSDTQRIQAAVNAAKGTTNSITIPQRNANGTTIWKIDQAILLPSEMTVILENCVIQLSDSCRDNMFRSDNAGIGIANPIWNKNIAIIGIGDVVLKGADNPRATGDGFRKLSLTTTPTHNKDRSSYGTDAGKENRKQKSDWRNFMVLMAYVDGFKLKNVQITYAHAWAVTFERVHHAELSNLRFYTPQFRDLNDKRIYTYNNDAINLREGCKYFRIDNITAVNGDDCIALSALDLGPEFHSNGNVNSYQITSTKHTGPEDHIEHVYITNIKTNYTGVGIRASDSASIHHIYINGITTAVDPNIQAPYNGSPYTVLLGNMAYGKPPLPGLIHNIYVMNIVGDGLNLIDVKSPIANCVFMNGIYTGTAAAGPVSYSTDKTLIKNVTEVNLVKIPSAVK